MPAPEDVLTTEKIKKLLEKFCPPGGPEDPQTIFTSTLIALSERCDALVRVVHQQNQKLRGAVSAVAREVKSLGGFPGVGDPSGAEGADESTPPGAPPGAPPPSSSTAHGQAAPAGADEASEDDVETVRLPTKQTVTVVASPPQAATVVPNPPSNSGVKVA